MRKKIVIFSAFATPFRSGAEACSEEVSAVLKDRYDITIVTALLSKDLPREDKIQGVKVVRVGFGNSFDKWLYPFLAAHSLRALKPDLVHAVLESYAGMALWCSKFTFASAKRLLTLQSTNTSFFLGPIHRSADRITAISKTLQYRAHEFRCHSVTLIPNGIRLADIQAACEQYRKVPGRVLFVGRLEMMKGLEEVMQAFFLAHEKYPDIQLHVVGDGSLRQNVQEMSLQVPGSHILGKLTGEALWKEFAEAQYFCALSRSEALGNVFLEAQAAGCAVIGTNVGGIPDIITDHINGMLVPDRKPKIAGAVLQDLIADVETRERISERAKKDALAYDWRDIAERYAKVYEELLHPQPSVSHA